MFPIGMYLAGKLLFRTLQKRNVTFTFFEITQALALESSRITSYPRSHLNY